MARLKTKYILVTLILIGIMCLLFKKVWTCCGCFGQDHLPIQIQPIDAYREVKTVFDSCDERTLVTFDVDDTLITTDDVLARTLSSNLPLWFKIRFFVKYFTVLLNAEKREKALDTFLGVLFAQAHRFVFDSDIVQLIRQLQQQKCNVVGLTMMGSGSTGVIKNLPEWRANMLKDFGIDFSGAFNDVSFTSFPVAHNNYPCLYKGILCANYASKGAVLGAFLDSYNLKPERIISFDDQQSALTSIANECAKRDIPFSGYQVFGAKKLPGEWNTSRALLQIDYALQHARWLSDKEADAILAGEAALTS